MEHEAATPLHHGASWAKRFLLSAFKEKLGSPHPSQVCKYGHPESAHSPPTAPFRFITFPAIPSRRACAFSHYWEAATAQGGRAEEAREGHTQQSCRAARKHATRLTRLCGFRSTPVSFHTVPLRKLLQAPNYSIQDTPRHQTRDSPGNKPSQRKSGIQKQVFRSLL